MSAKNTAARTRRHRAYNNVRINSRELLVFCQMIIRPLSNRETKETQSVSVLLSLQFAVPKRSQSI